MCQNNCNTEELKNKPLTQIELGKIESKLDEGYNATQIAEYLGRDSSCIQKEIKKFSIIKPSKKECKDCKNYEKCTQNKKQETIIKEIDKIEIAIEDKFRSILEKIITDNGTEFLKIIIIQKNY